MPNTITCETIDEFYETLGRFGDGGVALLDIDYLYRVR
jgi:hypothetical protein